MPWEAILRKLTAQRVAGRARRTLELVESTMPREVSHVVAKIMDAHQRSIAGDTTLGVELLAAISRSNTSVGSANVHKIEDQIATTWQVAGNLSEKMASSLIGPAQITPKIPQSLKQVGQTSTGGLVFSNFGLVRRVLLKGISIDSSDRKSDCGGKFGASSYKDVTAAAAL